MKIINIVGARPNFMKMAPIIEAMNRYPEQIEHLLVHTGQHYDEKTLAAAENILSSKRGASSIPEKWDGKSAGRIVDWLVENYVV